MVISMVIMACIGIGRWFQTPTVHSAEKKNEAYTCEPQVVDKSKRN